MDIVDMYNTVYTKMVNLLNFGGWILGEFAEFGRWYKYKH